MKLKLFLYSPLYLRKTIKAIKVEKIRRIRRTGKPATQGLQN